MERHWGAPVPAVPILPVPLPLQANLDKSAGVYVRALEGVVS